MPPSKFQPTMNDPALAFGASEIAPFIGERLDVFLAAVTGRSRSRAIRN